MHKWKTISQKIDYACPFLKIRKDFISYPSGKKDYYWVLERSNFAITIALDKNNCTYLVGQYRYAPERYSWELPMGGQKEGENILQSAKRELKEETGIKAKKWQKLGYFFAHPGISDQIAVVYLAQDLIFGQKCPDETEELKLKKISLTKLFKEIEDGTITDGPTIAASLFLIIHFKPDITNI